MLPYAYLPMLTHLVCLHTLTYQSSIFDALRRRKARQGVVRSGAKGAALPEPQRPTPRGGSRYSAGSRRERDRGLPPRRAHPRTSPTVAAHRLLLVRLGSAAACASPSFFRPLSLPPPSPLHRFVFVFVFVWFVVVVLLLFSFFVQCETYTSAFEVEAHNTWTYVISLLRSALEPAVAAANRLDAATLALIAANCFARGVSGEHDSNAVGIALRKHASTQAIHFMLVAPPAMLKSGSE